MKSSSYTRDLLMDTAANGDPQAEDALEDDILIVAGLPWDVLSHSARIVWLCDMLCGELPTGNGSEAEGLGSALERCIELHDVDPEETELSDIELLGIRRDALSRPLFALAALLGEGDL